MDPRIRIHTKMSWIRNTGSFSSYYLHEVIEGVEVRDPLVAEYEELVVRLLQHRHPLTVDLQLFPVELHLER
jgi:hypothetical protein